MNMDLGGHMVGHLCFPQFPGTEFLSLSIGSLDINWKYLTYIFKTIFAELGQQLEKEKCREPKTPHSQLPLWLHIQHTKQKDELVEQKVPDFVLEVLMAGMSTT